MNRRVRIVGVLLCLCALLSAMGALAQTAEPEEHEAGSWRFTVDENGGATLTRYKGREETVAIPEEIAGPEEKTHPVVALGEGAFVDNTAVREVTCPDSIAVIGEGAFEGCGRLETVRFPAGLEKIEHSVFAECYALAEIELPEGVASIGRRAFADCRSLVAVRVPVAVTSIRADAFSGCTSLGEVSFDGSVEYLGAHAFADTPFLAGQTDEFVILGDRVLVGYNGSDAHVVVPPWVRTIASAFEDCAFIETIELPPNLSVVGGYAFSGCTGLREIALPDSVRTIEEYAFSGCINLGQANMAAEGLTYIGENAFRDCRGLESLALPDTVATMEARAFAGCVRLTEVDLPEALRQLGSGAFKDCEALERVAMYQNLEKVSSSAFEGTGEDLRLEVVYGGVSEVYAEEQGIPYDYVEQQTEDFAYRRDARGVEITRYIGREYDVILPQTLDGAPIYAVGPGAFQGMEELDSIMFPAGLRRLDDWAFAWCTRLTRLDLPEQMEEIGSDAFHGCTGLTQVYLPNSIEAMGEDVFAECDGIVLMADKDSEAYAAVQTQGLTTLDALTQSGEWIFDKEDEALWVTRYVGEGEEAVLPERYTARPVVGIRAGAFEGTSLSRVTVTHALEMIEDGAFEGLAAPLDLYLEADVETIEDGALPDTVVLHAPTGTTAEAYARTHGNRFLVIHDR